MKIEKAIEVLTYMSKSTNVSSLEDCIDAIKLGKEALKQVEFTRSIPDGRVHNLLPGETKD